MNSSQDKQLPATGRKLQKARSDGQTARSRDLSHLRILGVGALGLLALAPWFVEYLQRALLPAMVFGMRHGCRPPGTMLQRLQTIAGVGVLASSGVCATDHGACFQAGGLDLQPQADHAAVQPVEIRALPTCFQATADQRPKMVLMTTILALSPGAKHERQRGRRWRSWCCSPRRCRWAGMRDSGSSRAWALLLLVCLCLPWSMCRCRYLLQTTPEDEP